MPAASHPKSLRKKERSAQKTRRHRTDFFQNLPSYDLLICQASALGILDFKRFDTESKLLESGSMSNRMRSSVQMHYGAQGQLLGMSDSAGRQVDLSDNSRRASGPVAQTAGTDSRNAQPIPRPINLTDDFGRVVATLSPNTGLTTRQFNEANQLIAMQDANGAKASYTYDAAGRIKEQTLMQGQGNKEASAAATTATVPTPLTTTTTKWHYTGRLLTHLEHPTQSEHYKHDARGLKVARTVIIPSKDSQGQAHAMIATTRYEHDESGQLIATQLPDGSRIAYDKNGQGQVVALTRNPIQTNWLRWAAPDQTLAKDFQRDLAGLSAYTAGNGVQSQWQRSPAGDLARIVHRAPAALKAQTIRSASNTNYKNNSASRNLLAGYSTQDTIERLLGINAAHAQTSAPLTTPKQAEAASSTLPGALGIARDPQALIDHRYLWDDRGNLLLSQNPTGNPAGKTTEQAAHAYTRQGQLIASVHSTVSEPGMHAVSSTANDKANAAKEQHTWRYAYDNAQRRVLSQETTEQSELQANTQKQQFQPNTAKQQNTDYDVAGMPIKTAHSSGQRTTHRELRWDAAGRLLSIGHSDTTGKRTDTASYQYDHRGLRNSKTVFGNSSNTNTVRPEPVEGQIAQSTTTHYLYSEDKQLLAEIDQSGKITRQYIYLADMPIAVIDSKDGKSIQRSLSKQEHSAQVGRAEMPKNASNSEQTAQPAAHHEAFEESKAVIIWADLKTIAHIWAQALGVQKSEHTAFIHTNHLGAPEAATDEAANPVWQASYAPFGNIIKASLKTKTVRPELVQGKATQGSNLAFILNLRLPGQYEDQESGLHYNRQRYYDPNQGSYISPDPLGTPDGPNPYAYTAFNPLKYIDPDGLVLFAFDGTENTDDTGWLTSGGRNGSLSNVVRFRNAYTERRRYITGVGTVHRDGQYADIVPTTTGIGTGSWSIPDSGTNGTGRARIDRMQQYFEDEADIAPNNEAMEVDIVGFSRGAAQARDFSNRITVGSREYTDAFGTKYKSQGIVIVSDKNGELVNYYRFTKQTYNQTTRKLDYSYKCQKVNFRFMGLWDTVLSTDLNLGSYKLGIPTQFAHVAHAVALNEYRGGGLTSGTWKYRNPLDGDKHYGAFPLESIGKSSTDFDGKVRIEMGFIGAHADIGGGYAEGSNQLSFVALNWMVQQATIAKVNMNTSRVDAIPTANPIIHDQSYNIRMGDPTRPNVQVTTRGVTTVVPGVNVREGRSVGLISPEDRQVNGAASGNNQRTMGFGAGNTSMINANTHQYIRYTPRPTNVVQNMDQPEIRALNNDTGTVDIKGYTEWLEKNGYKLK